MVAPVSDIQAEEAISAIGDSRGAGPGRSVRSAVRVKGSRRLQGTQRRGPGRDSWRTREFVDPAANALTWRRRAARRRQCHRQRPVPACGCQGLGGGEVPRGKAVHQPRGGAVPGAKGRVLFGAHESLPGEEMEEELPHVRELVEMAQGQLSNAERDSEKSRTCSGKRILDSTPRGLTELALKGWIALTGEQYQIHTHPSAAFRPA